MYVGWLLLVTSKVCCHDNGNVGVHVCAKFHEHTYTVLYAHNKGKGDNYVHCLRLVAIGYRYIILPWKW